MHQTAIAPIQGIFLAKFLPLIEAAENTASSARPFSVYWLIAIAVAVFLAIYFGLKLHSNRKQ